MTNSQQEYEFTAEQNHSITKLYHHMQTLGYLLISLGAVLVILVIIWHVQKPVLVKLIIGIVVGAISIILGFFTVNAGSYFKLVVKTEGSDISNMMNALKHLNSYFNIELMIIIMGLLGLLLGIVALFA